MIKDVFMFISFLSIKPLTHWGQNKKATVLQMTLSVIFLKTRDRTTWLHKKCNFYIIFPIWNWPLQDSSGLDVSKKFYYLIHKFEHFSKWIYYMWNLEEKFVQNQHVWLSVFLVQGCGTTAPCIAYPPTRQLEHPPVMQYVVYDFKKVSNDIRVILRLGFCWYVSVYISCWLVTDNSLYALIDT